MAPVEKDEFLKLSITTILNFHKGEENKINSSTLLNKLKSRYLLYKGKPLIMRNIGLRNLIRELRTTPEGCMIMATRKAGGGYFWARDVDEVEQHTGADLKAAITLINRTRKQRRLAGLKEDPQLSMEGF
jgi:hypothetical protein